MKIFAFFCLLLLFTGIVHAQDTTDWEVSVYIPNESAIVTLTAEGETERIALPETARELIGYRNIKLSANHRWLAFVQDNEYGLPIGTIYVADLQAGICCEEFGPETLLPGGLKPDYFYLADFSPDGTAMALLAMQYPKTDPCEHCTASITPFMVELTTMTVKPANQFILRDEQPVGWDKQGIALVQHPVCMPGQMCVDPTVISTKVVRQAETGEELLSMPVVIMNGSGQVLDDTLALTGEYISYHFYHPEWMLEGYYTPLILYYAPQMDKTNWYREPEFIYEVIGQSIDFRIVRWVLDGNAVLLSLMTYSDGYTSRLLMRDGTEQPLDLSPGHNFLAGTPDGWLMYEGLDGGYDSTPETMSLFHYRYLNGELTMSEIAVYDTKPPYSMPPVLLSGVPLGASVTEPFQTKPPLSELFG